MATNLDHDFLWESTARHAKWSASFPHTPNLELIPIGAELIQKPNHHDVLTLYFKGKPFQDDTVIVSGDPIKFTWNSGPNVSTFNGYVYSVDPSSGTRVHETTVVCMASSYLLKQTDQKIYKGMTADACISKAAKALGFQAVTERHPRIRETIVMAGQSYWQLFSRLAKQTGHFLRAENNTIYFLSKDKNYTSKKATAPYFKYEDGLSKVQRMYGTCFQFEPKISDENPDIGSNVDRVITGTNSVTGSALNTKHAPKDRSKPSLGSIKPSKDYFLGNI